MKAIDIRNVSKQYKSSKTKALDGINLSIEEGDFFALLGPNGAGKSTLISILSGLIKLDNGSVKIFEKDVPANHLVGVMQQEFNFNVFEQLQDVVANYAGFFGMPRKKAKERAEYALKLVDLWDRRTSKGISLSGGMKRRLMIARSIVHNPKVVILDEPTAGVDINIRKSMWSLLRDINAQGTTVILTTHYLEEAEELCKNVAIINKGKLILSDKMSLARKMLEEETIIIDVCSTKKLPSLDLFNARILDETTFEATVNKGGLNTINALFSLLLKNDITVDSIQNKSNRLESFFISKTKK